MKELVKGPNERGREDFENAISDDLAREPTMVARRIGPAPCP
jgi:hypothetical protein